MICTNKDGTVCLWFSEDRQVTISASEWETLKRLIINPPSLIEIKNPIKSWSPCSGSDCKHPSHNKE